MSAREVIGTKQAAERLGVSTSRVLARIADGSLPARKVGNAWILDPLDVHIAARLSAPGRRCSPNSSWALVAAADDFALDREIVRAWSAGARYRARARLRSMSELLGTEVGPEFVGAWVSRHLSARAERLTLHCHPDDVADMADERRVVRSGWSSTFTRVCAPRDFEAYVSRSHLAGVLDNWLLTPSDAARANIVLHVVEDPWMPVARATLEAGGRAAAMLAAADLSEHLGSREHGDAARLLARP